MKEKYNLKDIDLADINKSFIDGFEIYLRTNLSIQNNTIVNYLKNLRKILQIAFKDNIIWDLLTFRVQKVKLYV